MCGRYVIINSVNKTSNIVKKVINVDNSENYNAHPQQNLPIIKKYINGNTLEIHKWGIVPSWAKKKEFRPLINARIETINEKISFKKLIKTNRCIAVADGFYEWKREGNIKTPYYFFRNDKKTIFFAGIYSNNEFCLITENASPKVYDIHDRQPVIINKSDINLYLNTGNDGSKELENRNKPLLEFYKVSKEVNKPANNHSSLTQKI